jgi:putative aldouronate transport system substrate-binding protein
VQTKLSRRNVLQAFGITAVGTVLAACGGGAPAAPTQAPAQPAAPPTAAPAAATATSAPAAAQPTTAPAPTQAPAAATPTTPPATAAPAAKPAETIVEVIAESGWMAPSPIDYSDVNDAINTAIKDTGLKLEVSKVADFQQKPPLMFAAGEKFEFLFDAPWFNMFNFIANGYLAPIEDYFKDLTKLSGAYDERMRRANFMKGHLFGLPTWGFLYQSGHGMVLREDLRKQYNLAAPTNWDNMETLLMDAKKAGVGIVPSASWFRGWFGQRIHYQLIGDENAAGHIVDLDKGLQVVNRFESDSVHTDYAQRRRLVQNGLVPKNIADKGYDSEQFFEAGKAFSTVGDLGRYSSLFTAALKAHNINGTALHYDLSGLTDNAGFRQIADLKQWNFQVFNKNGKTDRALAFFDWILSDPANIDLWTLGLKGKHWTDTGNRTFDYPSGADPATLYHRPWYLSGIPMPFHRLPTGLPESDVQILKLKSTWDDKHYIESPLLGFAFDPEPLKTALAKNAAVITEKGGILEVGQAADVDKALKQFNDALKAAALDEELSKKQAQVDAFVKANPAQIDKFKTALQASG